MATEAQPASRPRGSRFNPDLRTAILRGAHACFARYGCERASMDDVAEAAGVSRATVYNYFTSKKSLVAEILVMERRRVDAIARRGLDLTLPSIDLLVEAELRHIDCALRSPYATLFTDPQTVSYTAAVVAHSSAFAEVQREYWAPVFEELQRRGDLNPELDHDEALNWLNSVEFLIAGPATFDNDPTTWRRYLVRYVVPAFLGTTRS